jgi:hypothetical protein
MLPLSLGRSSEKKKEEKKANKSYRAMPEAFPSLRRSILPRLPVVIQIALASRREDAEGDWDVAYATS